MAIAVDIQLPGVGAPEYAQMIGRLGPLLAKAPGFLAHSAAPVAGGFHVHELWRSQQEFSQFAEQHVAPLAGAAGLSPVVSIEPLERLLTPAQVGAARELATPPASPLRPLASGEGARFALGPITILVREDGNRTRQTFAVAEFIGKGFRIPPHVHTEHDESIYVLEGTLGVRLGEETFSAGAGTSFTIPVDVTHSLWNESEQSVRFLNTIVPARYLDYFHEMALVAQSGKLAAPEDMKRVMLKYGLRPS